MTNIIQNGFSRMDFQEWIFKNGFSKILRDNNFQNGFSKNLNDNNCNK